MNSSARLFLRWLALILLPFSAGAATYPEATITTTEGLVRSPHPPHRLVDVKGYAPGTLVRDPVSMKIFRVPAPDAPKVAEVPAPEAVPAGPDAAAGPGEQAPPELVRFLNAFVKSGELNDPAAELAFFAATVDHYFGRPNVGFREIVADRRELLTRWPERRYALRGAPVVLDRLDNRYRLKMQMDFTVTSSEIRRSGTLTGFVSVRETDDGYEITGIEQVGASPVTIERLSGQRPPPRRP